MMLRVVANEALGLCYGFVESYLLGSYTSDQNSISAWFYLIF